MKRFFIIIFDIIIIYICLVLSLALLDKSSLYSANSGIFLAVCLIEFVLFVGFSYVFGLYNNRRMRVPEIVYTIFLTSISTTIGTMAVCFMIEHGMESFSVGILVLAMLFSVILLTLWHVFEWRMAKKRHGIKDAMVLGKSGGTLARHIENSHSDTYRVKYICEENDPFLWKKIKEVGTVFLTSKISGNMRDDVFNYAFENETSLYFVPKYSDIGIINATLFKTDDVPTYRISKLNFVAEELFVKRAFDLLVAGLATIVFSPVFLIVSILEKFDGGSIFYNQERLTKGGKIFKVYKFRSMVPNAEKLSGPVLADEDDPRITRLGKILRATRMDELPQLLNVLQGDMSIVGPRPERPFFVDGFTKDIPEYQYRLKVKAGLTGLAQIQGKYNTHVTQKLRYDLMYINQYSILKDFIIVIQTIKILFMKSSTEGLTSLQKDKVKQKTTVSITN